MPQAYTPWRLLWRLVPRLLDRWSVTGRTFPLHKALSDTTSKV